MSRPTTSLLIPDGLHAFAVGSDTDACPRARRLLRNAVHFAIGLGTGAYLAAAALLWFVEGMPQ